MYLCARKSLLSPTKSRAAYSRAPVSARELVSAQVEGVCDGFLVDSVSASCEITRSVSQSSRLEIIYVLCARRCVVSSAPERTSGVPGLRDSSLASCLPAHDLALATRPRVMYRASARERHPRWHSLDYT